MCSGTEVFSHLFSAFVPGRRGIGAVGSASALQAEGRRFESGMLHDADVRGLLVMATDGRYDAGRGVLPPFGHGF